MRSVETGVFACTVKRGEDGVDARLRGHARQAVGGCVYGIGASHGGGNHRSYSSASRIVGMNVNGEVGVLLPDRANQQGGGMRLEYSSHVLNAQDVNVKSHKLVD